MGIEIIVNELPYLSRGQKAAISRFVNKNCSYYYFLNFIRITSGNVADAIKLYYFDEDLRKVLLKYILRLEIQMKKDLIKNVESVAPGAVFWNDSSFYNMRFTTSNGIQPSKFEITKNSILQKVSFMRFSGGVVGNDRAFYCCDFGNFTTLYANMLQQYRNSFEHQYIYNTNNTKEEIVKYFTCIRYIRNRCCHSNHIVSSKMRNQISGFNLLYLTRLPMTKFEQCLYFIYRNLDNKQGFKEELLRVLTKYEKYWYPYRAKHIFTENTINNIRNF